MDRPTDVLYVLCSAVSADRRWWEGHQKTTLQSKLAGLLRCRLLTSLLLFLVLCNSSFSATCEAVSPMTSRRKVRFRDASLIDNDVLRPWTINPNLDHRLEEESMALDKILAFTTPQKFAGTLASSVLDHPPPEYRAFKSTLDQRAHKDATNNSLTGGNSSRNGEEHSARSHGTNSDNSRRPSGAQTPSAELYGDCFDAADLAYIERIKSNMYAKSMRSTRARAQTALVPLRGVRYTQDPLAPLSPTKSKLIATTVHKPKLTPSVSHSKIPVVRNSLSTVRHGQQS